jgi:uncharacterized secreted repeat protein (TIGR03808 family)
MIRDRRRLLSFAAAASAAAVSLSRPVSAKPFPIGTLGTDATHFGVRPGSPDDQSSTLQRAVDECARTRVPLALPPGTYRIGGINLSSGCQLVGVRGATRLELAEGSSLIAARDATHVTLSGLLLDGAKRKLPPGRALVRGESLRHLKIVDCDIQETSGSGLYLVSSAGEVSGNTFAAIGAVAMFSLDAHGLLIARNVIGSAGDNGIQVFRSEVGDDGTIIADNRIENIENRSGGSGQFGNAINAFRAGNVIVRGNRIRNCAFSAVRGNAASNIQIVDNSVTNAGEVALYSEFAFEGAVIANNTVDGAALGVSVTNFNKGGRLAVVEGNIIRNLKDKRPAGTDPADGAGIGISVEADTAVTGNLVENAPYAGIMAGWGHHLRDVAVSGNVVRRADIGIAVSVTAGAGNALIANNLIADTRRGAILGMDRRRVVTDDLATGGGERFSQLIISGNRAR